jgi:DNA-directed RNA polymerase specialized sigma24 family protein
MADQVALVARAKRDVLLRVHRRRLRWVELEDCFSQAVLELVAMARAGSSFKSRQHIANALEQRFVSRTHDRRRALSGRSPMEAALEEASPLSLDGACQPVDPRAEPERVLLLRQELELLRAGARTLSEDQKLVLACQLALQMECEEFCRLHDWSREKYRKVAQRGRARLRAAMAGEPSVPPEARRRKGRQGATYDHLPPRS